MHYNIKKFKKEHLDIFEPRDIIKPEIDYLKEQMNAIKEWETISPVFTLFADEKPIMIYGLFPSGTGTYMVTVFAGKDVDKHVFRMVRCLYKYVEDFVGYDVRRFEGHCHPNDLETLRLAKFFGFETVGYRRQAGVDGTDQVILERLWRKS